MCYLRLLHFVVQRFCCFFRFEYFCFLARVLLHGSDIDNPLPKTYDPNEGILIVDTDFGILCNCEYDGDNTIPYRCE